MKRFFKMAACAAAMMSIFACNKIEGPQMEVETPKDAGMPQTKANIAGAPIMAVYVETNDVNPLNVLDYKLPNGKPFVDIAELFASNIRKETVGGAIRPTLFLNDKLANILENGGVDTYVRPLQAEGIKVLLTNLGDHQQIGLANMTPEQADQFATILAATVYHYGLDGIGFDDEYADYDSTQPVNSTSYSTIIIKLREWFDQLEEVMGKPLTITVFDWGYTNTISSAAAACIDYAYHGYFGSYVTSRRIPNLPDSKWSPLSFNLGSSVSQSTAQSHASQAKNGGYGAMMCFNLRTRNDRDPLSVFQGISNGAYGGQTVTCTNGNRSRDVVIDPDGFTITYDDANNWLNQ